MSKLRVLKVVVVVVGGYLASSRRGWCLCSGCADASDCLAGGSGCAARCRRLSRFLLQHGPVEGVVVLVVEGAEQDAEQLPQVHVVGALLEPEAAAVVEVHGEFGGEPFAQDLHGSRHLFLTDLLVLKKKTNSSKQVNFNKIAQKSKYIQ